YQFVWVHHHLILDGWSASIVFKEVLAFYEAFQQQRSLHLPAAGSYHEYIAWLQQQDLAASQRYWQEALQGFVHPTPLPAQRGSQQGEAAGMEMVGSFLSEQSSAALEQQARHLQVTVSTLLQGAWAWLLSRWSGQQEVLFGVTVAGRSAPVAGI